MKKLYTAQKTAVIIPFYQTETGLLRRAVKSVFEQDDVTSVHVIVADDGCPIAARDELKNIIVPDGFSLTIVRQPNRGPSAARNLGLENISDKTEFIAFLDSDDIWYPEHLQRAIRSLSFTNGDFYFAPCEYEDHERNAPMAKSFSSFADSLHGIPLDIDKRVREVQKFPIDLFMHSPGKIITSSVVIRRRIAPDLRFKEEFHSGEDVLFFWQYFMHSQHVLFSTVNDFMMCKGLNIWGKASRDFHHYMRLQLNERLLIKQLIEISSQSDQVPTAFLKEKKERWYFNFCRNLLKIRSWKTFRMIISRIKKECPILALQVLAYPLFSLRAKARRLIKRFCHKSI
jgi:succinoglycan biosynthesis protein ExoW